MNKNLLASVMALSLLMTAAASSQTVHVRAKIPFNFITAGATLPAGEYDIQSFGASQNLLSIYNRNSSVGKLFRSNPCDSLRASSISKLVFHRYGDRYFLAELWMQGQSSGYQVPEPVREKETAMDFPKSDVVLLLAQR